MSIETVDEPVMEENLTGHSYDGIQEYDNPLPGWWKFLFWVSVIISPIYFAYYHFGVDRSIHQKYEQNMAAIFELRFEEIGELTPDRATLLEYLEKPEWLAVGKVVYKSKCVSCHGVDGGGLVGPNLTDNKWRNVRKIEDIAKVINEGAANGSMPAWKNRISHPNQRVLTAAYVASMQNEPVAGVAADPTKDTITIDSWTD